MDKNKKLDFNKPFITTSDIETANKLKLLGFEEIPNSNDNIFTFINCKSFNIKNEIDITKVHYSSKLCI